MEQSLLQHLKTPLCLLFPKRKGRKQRSGSCPMHCSKHSKRQQASHSLGEFSQVLDRQSYTISIGLKGLNMKRLRKDYFPITEYQLKKLISWEPLQTGS